MRRERALKIVLLLVGLLFSALIYPMIIFAAQEPALSMMLSVYLTLGILLLLAARNPSANRSLIAFTAWSPDVAYEMARAYGCDSVITKPIDTRLFAQQINNFLHSSMQETFNGPHPAC